jgi:hypothetical protein
MYELPDGIRSLEPKIGEDGRIESLRVVFGPHYFLELEATPKGTLFRLGATHHGFEAGASEVGGELEQIIEHVRTSFPDRTID